VADSWQQRASGPRYGGWPTGMAYDEESDRIVVFNSESGATHAYDFDTDSWGQRASGSRYGGWPTGMAYIGALRSAAPTCSITSPIGGTVSGGVTVAFDALTPSGNDATATLELSTDGGATFVPATDLGGGSLTGNPTGTFGAGSHTWEWASRADLPMALFAGTILRVTVTDSVTGYDQSCSTTLDVDNSSLCTTFCGDCDDDAMGPTILDALTAAQISTMIVSPSSTQTGCCDVDSSMTIDIVDALLIARATAALPVTLTCP
jgi:hypothetical protein